MRPTVFLSGACVHARDFRACSVREQHGKTPFLLILIDRGREVPGSFTEIRGDRRSDLHSPESKISSSMLLKDVLQNRAVAKLRQNIRHTAERGRYPETRCCLPRMFCLTINNQGGD